MKKQLTTQPTYNDLRINTNEDKAQACFIHILDRHHAHLADMADKHSKVMQVRFDLRYPDDNSTESNKQHLKDFNYNLQRKLKREKIKGGHKVDPRLIVVTEQHHSQHPHHHGVLLVNANAKQHYYPLVQEVEKQWNHILQTKQQGLVDYCDKQGENGIIINRNKEDFEYKKNQCSYQASYIAKERGKENNPKGSWSVTGTRIPKNNKT